MGRAALGVILLLVTGCVQTWDIRAETPSAGERAYHYLHYETTGQMDYIMVGGKQTPIEFSDDSSPRALALLRGLKSEIFLPNVGGQNASGGIFLVGHYEDGYSLSAYFRRMLGGEGYHRFRLQRWYVAHPLLKDVFNQDMVWVKSVRLERLRKGDFDGVTPTAAELAALLRPASRPVNSPRRVLQSN